jgi:cysteine desulfurase / selenocysteine lyase
MRVCPYHRPSIHHKKLRQTISDSLSFRVLGEEVPTPHEATLLAHATEEMDGLDKVRIFGRAPGKGAIITFDTIDGHPHDVATLLNYAGVAVRAGTHCAQPLMKRYGITSSCRASFAVYNTHEEVDALVAGIRKALEFFA